MRGPPTACRWRGSWLGRPACPCPRWGCWRAPQAELDRRAGVPEGRDDPGRVAPLALDRQVVAVGQEWVVMQPRPRGEIDRAGREFPLHLPREGVEDRVPGPIDGGATRGVGRRVVRPCAEVAHVVDVVPARRLRGRGTLRFLGPRGPRRRASPAGGPSSGRRERRGDRPAKREPRTSSRSPAEARDPFVMHGPPSVTRGALAVDRAGHRGGNRPGMRRWEGSSTRREGPDSPAVAPSRHPAEIRT